MGRLICEARDVKGLYEKAREGMIKDFTGVSSPYEELKNSELIIDTVNVSLDDAVGQIIKYLKQKHKLIFDSGNPD